jgi:hypothetical protein
MQNLLYFFGNKIAMNGSLPPMAYCWYGKAQISCGLSALE